MKKLITTVSIFLVAFQFTACKKEVKKEEIKETPVVVKETAAFSLKEATNTVNFTAYKTTEKVPVKGTFKTVKITEGGEGESIKEAINGAQFKIPVGSIETKDDSRNAKIQQFFFSVMANSMTLTGKLNIATDSTGVADLTMNAVTQKLPFKYTIDGKTFSMKAIMNIDEWNAQSAVASLNEACKELHKGADGVSKTWSEVALEVSSTFK